MGMKEELKNLCKDLHVHYFGVAPVERFSNMPDGHKPEDLLPGAKAVIVIGVKMTKAVINAHKRVFTGGPRHMFFSFTRYGYKNINEHLDVSAFRIVDYIESNSDYIAYPIPSAEPKDEELYMSAFSGRYAAVAAGLAQFGWSGFAVTPKDGPRVRWSVIITDAPLEADHLYEGEQLCDPEKCKLCVKVCPVDALSADESVPVKIAGLKTGYAKRDKVLCRCATNGLVKGTPGRLQADVPEKMETMDDWYEFNKKNDPWQRMEFNHGNYCLQCMMLCPIGSK